MAKKNKKDKEAKKARAELKNQKNQKKQEKKFQKNKNKSLNGEEDDESDQDLDEILSSFSKKQIELEHVDITSVEKPSCRTHPLMLQIRNTINMNCSFSVVNLQIQKPN